MHELERIQQVRPTDGRPGRDSEQHQGEPQAGAEARHGAQFRYHAPSHVADTGTFDCPLSERPRLLFRAAAQTHHHVFFPLS
jgi:hypothetical protein